MKNINWGANLLYPATNLYPNTNVYPLEFSLLNARYYSKYSVDGKEYNQTLNEFKYSNIINPNSSISIGNTCSSSVAFSIFKPQITLENKDITIFEGVKGDSGIEYVQIGIFTVTKEESNGEYTKYTAYDKMYKAEKGYFSELTYPNTDKAILEEICTKLGIKLATSLTTTHTITDKPQGYTMREMIGYMAMLQGSNAAINSDGNLEIKWYKDSGYVLDGHQYYQQGVTFTTSKDFTIKKLTCNNTKSGDSKTSEITAGDGSTGLSFANPFMTQAILNEVYNKIGGFQFRPLTVKFLGDWRLEAGDIITINKGGVNYKVPIMQIDHECDGGLMSTVTSIGQSDTENSNIATGPITKQMERYYADLVLINKAVIDTADITNANVENLKAHQAYIDQLKANKIEAVTADIVNLTASKATINEANITKLQSDFAQVGVLNADVADIKTLMFGSATGKSLTTEFANSVVGVIGNAQIKDAMIDSISAGKITALDLNTTKFKVHSENGMSYWQDNTIIIKDTERVRVQIGKDANADYNMYVWDKSGNLMFDALGLTEKGVTRKVVRDDIVKDDANINASKLDIATLFNVINNDNTHTLKSNKIYLDNEKQTLNVIMQAITSGAGKDYTQWGGMMKVASDFITNKLWWTSNVDTESIQTKFSTVNQKLDSYEITLSDLYQQTNDNFMVYTVTTTPTKDNYPAIDWFIPIYPADDLFPSDNLTWSYSNDEYAKHHGTIAYNETAQKTWRWVKDDSGNWNWKEVSNTQLAYMLNQNASLKINLDSISTELSQTKKNLADNYSTTTQMNNAITQAITAESNSIKLEVSGTYATKKNLESYATNDSLKSYATTASLEAYIKKDPTTGELKSAIEAIADTINITARGGLNLSGNRFTLSSTNTSITADGTITSNNIIANYGKIAQWNIANNSINSTTADSKYWAGMTTPSASGDWVFATLTNTASASLPSWSPTWYVRGDGFMYAANATIEGSITATKSGVLTTTINADGISVIGSDNSTVITAQGFLTNQYLGSTVDCRGNIFNGMLVYPKGKTDLTYEWVAKISNTSIAISPSSNINLNYCTKMTNEEISINGESITTNYAKMTTYGFATSGNLYCGGTKNRMVETEHFGTVLQNALETPTPTFADYGEGILDETGMCRIYLEDKFIETIDTNTKYTIFLTKYGVGDIYVSDRQLDYFEVTGTPNLTFSWQLLATQRDYNSIRLDEKTEGVIDKVNSDELFKMTTEFIEDWEGDLDYAE